jgi:hypothetical protein
MGGTSAGTWIAADGGYELSLDGTTLVCRNPKGTVLKSVPAAVRKGEAAEQLLAVREWLLRHERDCRAAVESWMLRSLPVPTVVLAEAWPDPAWQAAFQDLLVVGEDAEGRPLSGLLRDASAAGAGVVTLDGESRRTAGPSVTIPHPVLIGELTDAREFLMELGASQAVPQLFRETFEKPAGADLDQIVFDAWSGARFKELRHALSRCATLGFRVSGGFATARVWEGGIPVEARYWVGADEPTMEAETGQLVFTDPQARSLKLRDVGPVAWSEGARMATLISAGGLKDGDGEAEDR